MNITTYKHTYKQTYTSLIIVRLLHRRTCINAPEICFCIPACICYLCRNREISISVESKISDDGRCRYKLTADVVISAQRLDDHMTMACDFVLLRITPLSQSQMFTSRTRASICASASACFVGGKSTRSVKLHVVSIQMVLYSVLLEMLC